MGGASAEMEESSRVSDCRREGSPATAIDGSEEAVVASGRSAARGCIEDSE